MEDKTDWDSMPGHYKYTKSVAAGERQNNNNNNNGLLFFNFKMESLWWDFLVLEEFFPGRPELVRQQSKLTESHFVQ